MIQTPDYSPRQIERKVPDWLEALESGRYEQTTHTMCDKNGYCCFGVADEVIFEESFNPHSTFWADSNGDIGMLDVYKLSLLGINVGATEGEIDALSTTLRGYYSPLEASRITGNLRRDAHGLEVTPTRHNLLAALNDARIPFTTIARYIRESGWFPGLLQPSETPRHDEQ